MRTAAGSVRAVVVASVLSLASFYLAGYLLYNLKGGVWSDPPTLLTFVLLCGLGAACALLAWASHSQSTIDLAYVWFRSFDKRAGICLLIGIALFMFGLVPVISYGLFYYLAGPQATGVTGLLAFLSGSASAVEGYFTLTRTFQTQRWPRISRPNSCICVFKFTARNGISISGNLVSARGVFGSEPRWECVSNDIQGNVSILHCGSRGT